MLGLSVNGSKNGLRRSHSWGGVGGSGIDIETKLLGMLETNYFLILKVNSTELYLKVLKIYSYNFQVTS